MGNGLSIRILLDQPQRRDKGVPYGEQRILISVEGVEWGRGGGREDGEGRARGGGVFDFWGTLAPNRRPLSYFAQREGEHASDRHHPHRIGST